MSKLATEDTVEKVLKPCPFQCGHPLKPVVSGHAIDPSIGLCLYTVRCHCGAQGPEHDNEAAAIDAWNTRAAINAMSDDSWQPIETAPKDEKIDIWLSTGKRWTDCYYDNICGEWRTCPSGTLMCIGERHVTHWRPRPEPPVAALDRLSGGGGE